ncbi:Serine/threonine protein kinase PrkC, regulator of stationary phase [Minicystis rosea]|nr:Serine/threonine protein kinase PrkC, regulator of stationary phase [Minicystis rosea]
MPRPGEIPEVIDDPETEQDATLVRKPTPAPPQEEAVTIARPRSDTVALAATVHHEPVPPSEEGAARTRLMLRKRFDDVSGLAPVGTSMLGAAARPVHAASFDQRYEARDVLGVGGMGEVKLCKDRLIGREVALKVMRAGTGSMDDARDRFVREARVQGLLEHPAIVPVYDLGVDPEGGVFFTMKRVRGRTLDAVIDALAGGDREAIRKYSRRKLLTAFGSVCLAVDFAHARGVLHRDLKPSNIILGDFGEVYVLDWGLAKLAGSADDPHGGEIDLTHDGTARTMLGSLIGTPGYMAPEQARGEIDRVDARADVYALGTILFEILAQEPLHPLTSVDAALASTLKGADARPSARTLGEYPPELEAMCVRATALDPAARYASARELSNAIERFLDGDRNVELRRDLAAAHVASARAALARAASGGPAAREARTEALRDVGSALALDPRNAEALSTMARLLTEVPDEVPPEAEAELEAAAARTRRQAARSGALRFMFWSALIPVAVWMGIRNGPVAAAVIASVVVSSVFSYWLSRKPRVTMQNGFALLALTSVAIALMSAPFGPFILVPAQAGTNTMYFTMSADKRGRVVVILLGVLAILIPFTLEIAGVLPPAYTFSGGLMRVMPRATELPALQTTICLLVTSLAMVIVPGLMVGRMRDALAAAERRVFLQAWHLRQLVPTEARSALVPAPSSHRLARPT